MSTAQEAAGVEAAMAEAEAAVENGNVIDDVNDPLAGGLAGWFKAEHFLEPNFDPDAYVAELRRYVRGATQLPLIRSLFLIST
jgi:hypothetical protein